LFRTNEIKEFAEVFNKDGIIELWKSNRNTILYYYLGFDIIYESIGADYVEANQQVIGYDAHWIVYSCQSGDKANNLSFAQLMKKRTTLTGTVLRARPVDYKTKLVKQFEEEAISGFGNGQLKVIIDKTWPMEQIADAHKHMEDNLTMGKLVMTVIQDKH
jgi:NADPH:quinone reductase-like Zn-dependent oxidoreductase